MSILEKAYWDTLPENWEEILQQSSDAAIKRGQAICDENDRKIAAISELKKRQYQHLRMKTWRLAVYPMDFDKLLEYYVSLQSCIGFSAHEEDLHWKIDYLKDKIRKYDKNHFTKKERHEGRG